MIRRINKNNDLKDFIYSCPTGVIDDIISIKYYIQGYTTEIEATFTKVGTHLEVIIPTSLLETLPNGILMMKAYYRVTDPSYPDGYYNLEFIEDKNIWLGEAEGGIVPPSGDYVTEEELTSTLSSYAAKSWVSSQEFATETWVESQGYIKSIPSDIATQSWVEAQGYLTSETIPSDIATQSWVSSQGYLSATNFKTVNGESIVGTGDIYFDLVVNIAASEMESYGYATKSWVSSQEFITSSALTGYATESWVSGQGYVSAADLSGYATQSWVSSQGYLTSETLPSDLATESWVQSQGYITSAGLSGYATESWVESQGYASAADLSGYVTESWVSNNYFPLSRIWTGTQSQWDALTHVQQAFYTIALITE